MNLLLDTHLLLWAAGVPKRLPMAASRLLDDPANAPIFGVASLWEIVIKRALGRDDFHADPSILRRGLLDNEYSELSSGERLAKEILARAARTG